MKPNNQNILQDMIVEPAIVQTGGGEYIAVPSDRNNVWLVKPGSTAEPNNVPWPEGDWVVTPLEPDSNVVRAALEIVERKLESIRARNREFETRRVEAESRLLSACTECIVTAIAPENPEIAKQQSKTVATTEERKALYARGWTDGLIKKHLKVARVEHRRIQPYRFCDVYHYLIEETRRAEASPNLQTRLQANRSRRANATPGMRERRSVAAKTAAATKAAATMKYARECTINVRVVTEDKLGDMAIDTYGGGYQGYREYPGFNDRIAVNCIRHNFTNYEKHLAHLKGRVATGEAYRDLKVRVLEEIIKYYPQYEDECDEQINQIICEPIGPF